MRFRLSWTSAPVLLVGCGLNYAKFQDKFAEKDCEAGRACDESYPCDFDVATDLPAEAAVPRRAVDLQRHVPALRVRGATVRLRGRVHLAHHGPGGLRRREHLMRGLLVLGLAGLVGCGVSEEEFVPAYVDHYCVAWLDCTDPAELVFDGIDGTDYCLGTFGPVMQQKAETCKLKKGRAKRCLDEMALLTCPSDGELDDALPLICNDVWHKCLGEGAATTPDEVNEDTG